MQSMTRWGCVALLGLGMGSAVAAEFVPEQITIAPLPPGNPYRLFVSDVAISHIIDGRTHIIDGENMKYAGMLGTGFIGLTTLSPDRKEIYVATTYLSRLNRGTRTDVVDVYDAESLKLKEEIELPPKRAQALPYKGTIATTPDGRFVMVQNATPASSISIVDRKASKFTAEVPTPGCWGILPAQGVANRFSTICGDGTLLTIDIKADGGIGDQQRSERLFDPDKGPIFTQTENNGDNYYFLSFHGLVHSANLGGPVAKIGPTVSLVDAEDKKKNWRPGGYQPFAYHKETGRLYVAMHPDGEEGSHKNPAAEIWAFDLAAGKRVARVPGTNAISLATSRGSDKPLLFAIDALGPSIASFSTSPTLAPLKRLDGVGEVPILIETH